MLSDKYQLRDSEQHFAKQICFMQYLDKAKLLAYSQTFHFAETHLFHIITIYRLFCQKVIYVIIMYIANT